MSFVHFNYANTSPTTLSGGISATLSPIPINSVTWPLVTPFEIVIDRGNLSQETCLVNAGATSTSLPVTRNYDGKSGPSVGTGIGHNSGATVEMAATSIDLVNFNLHATSNTRDDHLNLMRSDGTRHNSATHHVMGTSLPGGAPLVSNPGDTQADGVGSALAYADHIHPRGDTWATYLNHMIRPGMILPASLGFNDSRFLPADGKWHNQLDWPLLYTFLGQQHLPILAGPKSSFPFNNLVHFPVPAMGTWDPTLTVFTWFQGVQWVVMASF